MADQKIQNRTITSALLIKSSSQKPAKNEEREVFLKKLTHSNLNEKGIQKIVRDNKPFLHLAHEDLTPLFQENLEQCPNLRVLYLYDNFINTIENIGFATKLTHLYLGNNNISKMEGMETLKNLTKLYLGGNSISVVEGLENCVLLEELHIPTQSLPEGQELTFCPGSIGALRVSVC